MSEVSDVIRSKEKSNKVGGEKYLTFVLGEENYAFPILKVQEIIGLMNITRVPKTPPFICGIINLRGKVVPVIDLRTRFNLEKTEGDEKTCIIVVQVQLNTAQLTMGILVDEVSEVIDINSDLIEPTPNFGNSVKTDFISGIGKLEKKVVVLLNVEKILDFNDSVILQNVMDNVSN